MIQCEGCRVWQHCDCVGIDEDKVEVAKSPEKAAKGKPKDLLPIRKFVHRMNDSKRAKQKTAKLSKDQQFLSLSYEARCILPSNISE